MSNNNIQKLEDPKNKIFDINYVEQLQEKQSKLFDNMGKYPEKEQELAEKYFSNGQEIDNYFKSFTDSKIQTEFKK